MRLTDHTDYSLRVLIYLNREKKTVTLNELSASLGISKNNLIKASNQLAKLEYIETTQGRSGGLKIKEETGKKSLRDIVSKTEESFLISGCFTKKTCRCGLAGGCYLKRTLADALSEFFKSLDQQTLNDVTAKLIRETKQQAKGIA